jgi:hypothetical protein
MVVDRIKYTKQFFNGITNEWIGMEAQLDKGDIVEPSMIELRSQVEKIHNQFNEPRLHDISQALPVSSVDSREEKIKAMVITISECRTVRNLEMFANEVQRLNDPSLFEAYNNKKKEL